MRSNQLSYAPSRPPIIAEPISLDKPRVWKHSPGSGLPPSAIPSHGAGRMSHGLMTLLSVRTSKCRCAPLDLPVLPAEPIVSP